MLVLFYHKSIVNFIIYFLFVSLFKKYCNDYYSRSAELPYVIALMTNMIIDHYYVDYINNLYGFMLVLLHLTLKFNLLTI